MTMQNRSSFHLAIGMRWYRCYQWYGNSLDLKILEDTAGTGPDPMRKEHDHAEPLFFSSS